MRRYAFEVMYCSQEGYTGVFLALPSFSSELEHACMLWRPNTHKREIDGFLPLDTSSGVLFSRIFVGAMLRRLYSRLYCFSPIAFLLALQLIACSEAISITVRLHHAQQYHFAGACREQS
ncbi:hypothetical protein KI387_031356, partial [Taxus chinensis]